MAPRIFWIGDSTVQYNNISTWPQCGMGQALDLYLAPSITVCNHARNGRSTKSFREEGLWAPVEAALRPGDLLLIQFGHNVMKSQRILPATLRLSNMLPICWPMPVRLRPRVRCLCLSRRWCAVILRVTA